MRRSQGLDRRIYNHRAPADLAALEADLQTLPRTRKMAALLMAIEAGLFRPLWPIRLAYAAGSRLYGCADATGRISAGMSNQFPRAVDGLWRDLMQHMTQGRNTDDPTSAGGWNHRELRMFLFIVETLGWTPPESDALVPSETETALLEAASS